jgi:hypothetical protein
VKGAPGRRPQFPRQTRWLHGRRDGRASAFVLEPRVGVGRRPLYVAFRRRPRCSSAVLRWLLAIGAGRAARRRLVVGLEVAAR